MRPHSPASNAQCDLQVERHVRWVWRFLLMPLLFGLIGTSVNFKVLANGTITKAVGIVFAGEPAVIQLPSAGSRLSCMLRVNCHMT